MSRQCHKLQKSCDPDHRLVTILRTQTVIFLELTVPCKQKMAATTGCHFSLKLAQFPNSFELQSLDKLLFIWIEYVAGVLIVRDSPKLGGKQGVGILYLSQVEGFAGQKMIMSWLTDFPVQGCVFSSSGRKPQSCFQNNPNPQKHHFPQWAFEQRGDQKKDILVFSYLELKK